MNTVQQIADGLARDVRAMITTGEGGAADYVLADFEDAIRNLSEDEREQVALEWWNTFRRLGANDD